MKKILSLLLALTMVFALCACGSSFKASSSPAAAYDSAAGYASNSSAQFAAEEAYMEYGYAEEPSMPVPAPASAAGKDDVGGLSADATAEAATGTGSTADAINPEKIIYSADAQLETTKFDETVADVTDMITAYGGFVESSSVNGANYYNKARGYTSLRSANYTIRIPSGNFSAMMNALPTLGNVPYTNTYTENVTSQYYDVQARLTAYRTQETRLIEMMSVAETVEDIIKIEDRLTEIRYQIDSMQSRLNNWDRRVNYSTIYLSISEVSEYTPTEPVRVTYGEKLGAAVKSGLKAVGNFFSEFLLWFVEALPTLIILALIALVIVIIIRKTRGNREARRERRAQRRAEKAAKKAAAKVPAAAQTPEDGAAEK